MMQHKQRNRDARRNLAAAVVTICMVAIFVIHNIRYAQSKPSTAVTAIKKQRLRGSSFVAPDAQPFVSCNCKALRSVAFPGLYVKSCAHFLLRFA